MTPRQISRVMSAIARLPRRLSPEERLRRSERMRALNARRKAAKP